MKICPKCSKEHECDFIHCSHCHRKIREEKRRNRPCSSCNRTDVLIYVQSTQLCVMCWRKKRIEEDPEYRNKRKQWQRKYDRKKYGRPLDQPLVNKPNGWARINKDGYRTICPKKEGYLDEMGYWVISRKNSYPNSRNSYRVREHRWVMSQHLGRPLKKEETVHHKNGIRHDNRLENLELWTKNHPAGQRVEDKIKWAKEFLEEYGYKIEK